MVSTVAWQPAACRASHLLPGLCGFSPWVLQLPSHCTLTTSWHGSQAFFTRQQTDRKTDTLVTPWRPRARPQRRPGHPGGHPSEPASERRRSWGAGLPRGECVGDRGRESYRLLCLVISGINQETCVCVCAGYKFLSLLLFLL